MGILGRTLFKEITTGALLGAVLFTFILFLQRLGRLFEQLVTSTATAQQIGGLFLLILPQTLVFTIPVGVLVGILIAIGRMSSDGEIIAIRSAGVPSRRLLIPVSLFAILGMTLAAFTSCLLTPWAKRETINILNTMAAGQLTAEIQPRIFEEEFPNRILYVEDVSTGPPFRWRHVFMADLRPPAERDGAGDRGDDPGLPSPARPLPFPTLPTTVSSSLSSTVVVSKSPRTSPNTTPLPFRKANKPWTPLSARKSAPWTSASWTCGPFISK